MGIKTIKFSKTFEAGRRSILTRHSLTGHSFRKLVASGYFPDQPFSSTHVCENFQRAGQGNLSTVQQYCLEEQQY